MQKQNVLNSPKFNAWCDEVDQHYCELLGWSNTESPTTDSGRESWLGYFQSSYTPEQAAREELAYAAS